MRIASYIHQDSISFGFLTDKGISDIRVMEEKLSRRPRSVKHALMMGPDCLKELKEAASNAETALSLEDVKLLPPIVRPGKIIGLAGNYAKHIEESGKKLGLSQSPRETTTPRPFLMPHNVLTGTENEIPWPVFSEQIDYEIELAVVIGKPARCVSVDEALEYVAGYSICNDISARSVTFAGNRQQRPWDEFYDWLHGKWADGFFPLGPVMVTADEIGNPHNLELTTYVNGELRQQANTAQMIFRIDHIVSFISHVMSLEPGDVIATGTPQGVGMADSRFLSSGDRVDCTIKEIGTLTNTLGRRPAEFYDPLDGSH